MSEDFVKVAETKDIQATQMKAVEVAGEDICVANVDGKYYAIGNICTHVGGPLDQGTLEGYQVECPGMDLNLTLGLANRQSLLQRTQSQPMR